MIFSHSRLQTFFKCPHAFKLAYIDELQTEGAYNMSLGNVGHGAIYSIFTGEVYNIEEELNKQLFLDSVEPSEKMSKDIEKISKLKGAYERTEARKWNIDNLQIEERIVVDLNGLECQMYIDLSGEYEGQKKIDDLKTSSSKPYGTNALYDLQLLTYKVGKFAKTGHDYAIGNTYLIKTASPYIISTQCDKGLDEGISLLYNEMKVVDDAIKDNYFPPTGLYKKDPYRNSGMCEWCLSKNSCKAHLSKEDYKPKDLTDEREEVKR